jgi:hypothetical protein
MRLKQFFVLTLAVLFVFVICPVYGQTVPAASEGSLPLAVGGGISSFNPDWAHGRMMGTTLWADWFPTRLPSYLHGFGVDAEARDLNFGRASTVPKLLTEASAGGGVIYSSRRYRNVRPYGKALLEFGGLTWGPSSTPYHHDTRTVTVFGGGLEVRAYRNLWVRADYEYQFWPDLFGNKTLNPSGFTVGAMYHFSRPHFSRGPIMH